MRQLIVTEFVSLDGVVEAPGGGEHPHGGWLFKDVPFDEAAYEIKGREMAQAGALLLGRVSYQEFAPIWPKMEEFATYNAMPKYVVSTTLTETDPGWEATILRNLDDVAALKDGEGGALLVHGSAALARRLLAAGLVDRYHLLTFPVVLGGGKRMFGEDRVKARLTLAEHAAYRNGVQLSVYDVLPTEGA